MSTFRGVYLQGLSIKLIIVEVLLQKFASFICLNFTFYNSNVLIFYPNYLCDKT